MNPVVVKREVRRIAFHPHGVDQSGDTFCNPLREERLDAVVDLLSQLVLIRDSALGCEERAVYAFHRMVTEKLGAKQNFVQVLSVKPVRINPIIRRARLGFFCFGQSLFPPCFSVRCSFEARQDKV